jgi:peptidoglycan-N-acetylglucosamine deacetylase
VNPFLISVPAAVLATGGVTAYGAVHSRAQLFGPTICKTNSPRKLAITFDDGPNPAITPKLLDLLDRYQAKATFFLIGRFVRECAALVKETVARGHALGNHTDTHPNLFWSTSSKIAAELRRCHDAISEVTGAPPKWFRPPYGFRNPWVIPAASGLGYRTVMWTLIPGDWREKPVEWLIARMNPIATNAQRGANNEKQIPRACLPQAGKPALGMTGEQISQQPADTRSEIGAGSKGDLGGVESVASASAQARMPVPRGTSGDILCLHDGWYRQLNGDRTRTLGALEYWLPRWRDLGLEFVTIDDAVR